MSDRTADTILFTIIGAAIGALATFIYMSYTNMLISKTTITELTRDANGHVIEIIERRV